MERQTDIQTEQTDKGERESERERERVRERSGWLFEK